MSLKNRERRDILLRLEGFPYRAELLQGFDRAVAKRNSRQCGTTAILAMNTIATAMQFPNVPVVIIDHHRTRQSDRYLAERIQRYVYRMELKRITVLMTGHSSPCVMYHPHKETM